MSLTLYNQKRDFKKTAEPKGKVARGGEQLQFVIQKHDASRLHYDFRLELDGVLKSWAVPKGPSLDPARKALAVHVEDHPVEYGSFEGVIPKGEYGGGTVLLWDTGTWESLHDPREGYDRGRLHFVLHGKKLKGEWSLVRMHGRSGGDGKNWLLMKVKDKFATTKGDVLADNPQSVKSKREIAQVADERDDVWSSDAKDAAKTKGAKKAALPTSFSPQLAVLATHPPEGDQWLHEIKFDGYRLLAFIKNGTARMITRNGHDWTDRFPGIAKALEKLKVDSAIIDGEGVVLDDKGRSDFQALQAMMKGKQRAEPILYAFDLPFCNGVDLRDTPLIERKARLEKLLKQRDLGPRIHYSDHFTVDGDAVLGKACTMGLEGIISKRSDAPYVSRRDASWVKSKCDQRQEFVVIGFTPPQGSRKGFGALLIGYYDAKKQLVYAGRVGTGFDDRMLGDLHAQLKKLEVKSPPTAVPPPARERRLAHWAKPTLVAEVRFTGWTRDGVLRHPTFIALRSDKPASQIVREAPVELETDMTSSKKSSKRAGKSQKAKGAKGAKGGTKSRSAVSAKAAAAKPSASKAVTAKSMARKSAASAKSASAKSSAAKSSSTNAATGKSASAKPATANVKRGDASVAGTRLSHPDKLLYPDPPVTKLQVAEYYEQVAKWMLPQAIDRPLALVRCPGGQTGKCFFQRNWSNTLPKEIGKVDVGEGRKKEWHVGIHDLAGLISLVQMSVLEVHTWGCSADDVEHPNQLVFDLDPGPDVTWKRVVEAARVLHRTLDDLKLPQFLKTSGGKGVHIVVPIEPTVDWDSAKHFCETIAHSLADSTDMFVANMRKDLRGGKVYIDYHRNGRSATAVAPYSTRARSGAPVSMPISWEELGKLPSAAHFTVETARQYLTKRKTDPWRAFDKSRIDLRKAVRG